MMPVHECASWALGEGMTQDLDSVSASEVGEDWSGELSPSSSEDAAAAAAQLGRAQPRRPFYKRTVDSWIPDGILLGPADTLRRARMVVGFTFVLLLLATELLLFFHWALPPEASIPVDLAVIASMLMTLGIPMLLRRGAVEAAANLIVAASFLVCLASFSVVGGIQAPVLHWVALMPLLAILMGSRRSAWAWAGVGMLMLVGFAAANQSGYPFPNYLEGSAFVGTELWQQRVVDVGSWIFMLLFIGLVYERHKDAQTAELEAINQVLTHEISQRRRAEEKIRYLAYYDELTTLPNRQLFKEHLRLATQQALRSGRLVGLLFVDLDGFKEVNDTHGHSTGDALLRAAAKRLLSCVRGVDSVARAAEPSPDGIVSRLGGDEFTLMLADIRSHAEAGIVAERILKMLSRPFELDGHQVAISASIGIAVYPNDAGDLDDLLKNADVAMYHAKEMGKNNFQFFAESMNQAASDRANLARQLRAALSQQEFVLFYQPIVEAGTGRLVSIEALLRWQHETRGTIEAGEFIEAVQDSSAIAELGDWVLEQACLQNKRWQQETGQPVRVSVNVSSGQFRGDRLVESVRGALESSGLDPQWLELEITETAIVSHELEVGRSLEELKQMGVRISLDDFGTGYSSLSYLRRFPVDALKIDGFLTRDVATNLEAQATVSAIITMAHSLGLDVVAEAVETEEQARFLADRGCDALQGYRFGRPELPGDLMARFLD